jgi:hypothetical protein
MGRRDTTSATGHTPVPCVTSVHIARLLHESHSGVTQEDRILHINFRQIHFSKFHPLWRFLLSTASGRRRVVTGERRPGRDERREHERGVLRGQVPPDPGGQHRRHGRRAPRQRHPPRPYLLPGRPLSVRLPSRSVSPPRFIICFTVHFKLPFAADDPFGDPYCTVFVGHLSRQTDEETVRKVMSYLAGTVLVLACWMWDVPLAYVWGMVASCWMQAMNR